jgi:hypothetical protein
LESLATPVTSATHRSGSTVRAADPSNVVFVQPSSLIFLVIIAIWAAYLLQHWVRRREHLATARSVDRFSEAMRVLERRTPLPASDLSLPQPRSYSVSPARPSRSEVVVKRAQSPEASVPKRTAVSVRSTRVFHALAGMSARRVRGLSFLASLSLVVVFSTLAAFSVLPWWSVPAAVAVLVADFGWLRHVAVTERATRRSEVSVSSAKAAVRRTAIPARSMARSMAQPSAAQPSAPPAARPDVQSEPVVGATVGASGVAATGEAVAAPGEAGVATVGEAGVATVGEASEGTDLSGWAPVPVPPPTYTLKAKAQRPQPVPAAVSAPAATSPSSFDGLVDEGELDGLLDRRRAAGA